MKQVVLEKYHCMGNDYLVFDPNKNDLELNAENIKKMCSRHFGIGADGILAGPYLGENDFYVRIYNADGSSRSRHFTGGSGFGGSGTHFTGGSSFGGSSAHFGGGSGFGGFGGSQGFHSADFREKGSDLTSDVTISFDEAVSGCEKLITLQNPQTGKRQSLQVHIPAGIDTGKSIRLKGKGMPGTGGGEAGDLLLNITVTAKPGWERKEMDVYSTVRIPFTTAVFGGEALVSTLYGNVLCKIAAGTQSGTKIKLKGKGIVSMKNPSIHGNQYVTVQIDVPNHLTPEAEQKLREFEHACGLNKNSQGGPNGRSAA